jgi:hypothetical protein
MELKNGDMWLQKRCKIDDRLDFGFAPIIYATEDACIDAMQKFIKDNTETQFVACRIEFTGVQSDIAWT